MAVGSKWRRRGYRDLKPRSPTARVSFFIFFFSLVGGRMGGEGAKMYANNGVATPRSLDAAAPYLSTSITL